MANVLAHENTVLIMTTMGAVAVTEQAIINDAHARGMVQPQLKVEMMVLRQLPWYTLHILRKECMTG